MIKETVTVIFVVIERPLSEKCFLVNLYLQISTPITRKIVCVILLLLLQQNSRSKVKFNKIAG